MRPEQSPRQQPADRNQLAVHVRLLTSTALKIGTAGMVAFALILISNDLSHWTGTFAAYNWSLSSDSVMPGEWVTARLEIPEASDLERLSLRLDLPAESGLHFVPGSLELYSGSLEGCTIPDYGDARVLRLDNIPHQTSALHLEIAIYVSNDLSLLGQSVSLNPEFNISGGGFHDSPVILNIHAPPLHITQTAVLAAEGKPGFEIEVSNPEDGLDFLKLNQSFDLDVVLSEPEVQIFPAEVHIISDEQGGQIALKDQGVLVKNLRVKPGEHLSVFFPINLPEHLEADQVKSFSRVKVGQITLGEGDLVRSASSGVVYHDFRGEIREERALLSWQVFREQGNKAFVVEHSTDAVHYKPLVMIPGSEDHEEVRTYQYETERLGDGRHLFRLRQESFSGAHIHTPSIDLFVGYEEPAQIHLNEYEGSGIIRITVPTGRYGNILLTDQHGEVIKTLYSGHLSGRMNYDILLDRTTIPEGEYQIVFRSGTQEKSTPLLVKEALPRAIRS